MGNKITSSRKAKVMTIDGKTFELKTPVRAGDVTKDYSGHVLIESEAVKNYGIRAEPLEPHQELKSKRLYFLVEIPKNPDLQQKNILQRKLRLRPGVHMSAKERMESLILSRRARSDLSSVKPRNLVNDAGMVRVKLRLPKSEVAKLMAESRDESEAAEKIMDLCITKSGLADDADPDQDQDQDQDDYRYTKSGPLLGYGSNGDVGGYGNSGPLQAHSHWRPGLGSIGEGSNKPRREKKVSFFSVKDEELE